MKLCFLQNVISPHILPLAKCLADNVGSENFRYCSMEHITPQRRKLGWSEDVTLPWLRVYDGHSSGDKEDFYEGAGVYAAEYVVCGIRDWDVLKHRDARGRRSIYVSERWFKPPIGILRLLSPRFLRMAMEFVKVLTNSNVVQYFPVGIHAAEDMARLCGLLHGDIKCLFRAPELDFDHEPYGDIRMKNGKCGRMYCLDKMRMWGYFVEPSKTYALQVQEASKSNPCEIKVLWVGRLLNLKRVDTIVRAVGEHANLKRVDNSLPKITLDICGTGPEEKRLKKMAAEYGDAIKFHPPVPIAEVRKLMQDHDVYVLASNAYEGWGAVVSEALEEGMKIIGTYEAGSSATILPDTNLFHAGDWRSLMKLLNGEVPKVGIGAWNPNSAAKLLVQIANGR